MSSVPGTETEVLQVLQCMASRGERNQYRVKYGNVPSDMETRCADLKGYTRNLQLPVSQANSLHKDDEFHRSGFGFVSVAAGPSCTSTQCESLAARYYQQPCKLSQTGRKLLDLPLEILVVKSIDIEPRPLP